MTPTSVGIYSIKSHHPVCLKPTSYYLTRMTDMARFTEHLWIPFKPACDHKPLKLNAPQARLRQAAS